MELEYPKNSLHFMAMEEKNLLIKNWTYLTRNFFMETVFACCEIPFRLRNSFWNRDGDVGNMKKCISNFLCLIIIMSRRGMKWQLSWRRREINIHEQQFHQFHQRNSIVNLSGWVSIDMVPCGNSIKSWALISSTFHISDTGWPLVFLCLEKCIQTK